VDVSGGGKTMILTTKIVQGLGWAALSQVARLLFQVAIIALLARLLTPQDFGLIVMVTVFTNFVTIFRDFGLTTALVQRKELTQQHLFSSFWISIAAGLLLSTILFGVAPEIASFYKESRLTSITRVLSSVFFISSFGIVQTALFTRELRFKVLAVVEILAVVISGTIAVGLAFAGFGVWSLVWRQVISSFAIVTFLWAFSRWRVRLFFQWQRVKELLSFGLNLTGFNFVNYFNRNLDNLLIGKFLGSALLGFYSLAYQLLLFPLGNISQVLGRVMFPVLSTIQENKREVRYVYLRAIQYIATISFPMMLGLFVLAPQFVRVIFGFQWERSIFLIQILALVGLIQSISHTVGWIYHSQGRTDIQLRWGLFFTIIIVLSFIIGLRWDVEGVTIAYAIATLLLTYPALAIPFRLIKLRVGHFFKQLILTLLAALGMAGTIFGLSLFLGNTLMASDLTTLVTGMTVGVLSYAGLLWVLDRDLYREVFRLLNQLKPSPPEIAWQEDYDSRSGKVKL